MSSFTRNENSTKTSKYPLANSRIQLTSNLEKLLSQNKTYKEQIKNLDESIQKALENKEILIKENANKRAVYNGQKKTVDVKREFLSSIANNPKSSNEGFDKFKSELHEKVNKNLHIYGNISNLIQCKNHLIKLKAAGLMAQEFTKRSNEFEFLSKIESELADIKKLNTLEEHNDTEDLMFLLYQ